MVKKVTFVGLGGGDRPPLDPPPSPCECAVRHRTKSLHRLALLQQPNEGHGLCVENPITSRCFSQGGGETNQNTPPRGYLPNEQQPHVVPMRKHNTAVQ